MPGETVYSACARFNRRAGYRNSKVTSLRLLGHPRGGSQFDLPSSLAHLAVVTDGTIAAEERTLRERTVLGSYLPLMSAARRQKVVDAVLSPSGFALAKAYSGLSCGIAGPHALRLCPDCLAAQVTELGFGYWKTEHQLPGVWVCREHRCMLRSASTRRSKHHHWLMAGRCPTEVVPIQLDDAHRLERLADCVHWLSSSASVNYDALVAMVRTRLHEAGHVRTELKASAAEIAAFHRSAVLPLAHSGVSQLLSLQDERWAYELLRDERSSHPLKWSVLLSAAGSVDANSLSRQYKVAISRLPQPQLFDESVQPRRSRAPDRLYGALTGSVTIEIAAATSNMRVSEVRNWLRRDVGLGEHWRTTSFEVRRREAMATIEACLEAHPTLFRSEVIKRCLWAVRWLEQNDKQLLKQLLPPPQVKYAKQLRLALD